MLPITFDATEKRTHDYRRHGTTNLVTNDHQPAGHDDLGGVVARTGPDAQPPVAAVTRLSLLRGRQRPDAAGQFVTRGRSQGEARIGRSTVRVSLDIHR